MASDGIQTHLFELVPTPARAPRALHSVRSSHGWLRHDPETVSSPEPAAWLDAEPTDACLAALAERVAASVAREQIGAVQASLADPALRASFGALRANARTLALAESWLGAA